MKSVFIALFSLTNLFVYSQSSTTEEPVKIEKNKVISHGDVFETNLFDLEFVGQLKAVRKKPFLILIGRRCDSCDVNSSVYIHSPSDGPLKNESKQKRYNLPGPIFDYQSRDLLYAARLFWGEVIPNRFGIIWFQRELKNNRWDESVYFAELMNDHVTDEFIKSELKTTLTQVEKGKAWEIKGEPISSEP